MGRNAGGASRPIGWAAVVAALDTGQVQVGSGYLVTDRLVLTAGRCTVDKKTGRPAASRRVVRRSRGLEAPAIVIAAALDAAVLAIKDPPWPVPVASERPPFGRVDRGRSGELDESRGTGIGSSFRSARREASR